MSKKYPEKMEEVPCEKCGLKRKFRKIKHSGLYKNYKPLCACCSGRSRKHPTKSYIDVIDTEVKAYAFGFFWADGCINRYKTFTVRLQTKDADILDAFHQHFGGSRTLLKNLKRSDGRPYQQEQWVIHDKVFIDKLKACGFRQHLNAVPDKFIWDFLRGLIDGDGHFDVHDGIFSQITISGPIDEDFEWLTQRLNVPFSINKSISEKSNSTTLRLNGGHNHLATLVRKMYEGSSISLERKRELVIPIMSLDLDDSREARMLVRDKIA